MVLYPHDESRYGGLKLNKPNNFYRGEWQYHPALLCDVGYPSPNCRRTVLVILNERNYINMTINQIYEECYEELKNAYPDGEFEIKSIIDHADLHIQYEGR